VACKADWIGSLYIYILTRNHATTINTNNTTNNINTTTVNNINILRNFNEENLMSVRPTTLTSAFRRTQIDALLQELHYNPDFPENHNLSVRDRDTVSMFVKGEWRTLDDAITCMVHQGARLCREYGNDNRAELVGAGMSLLEHDTLMSKVTLKPQALGGRSLRAEAYNAMGGTAAVMAVAAAACALVTKAE
jgi:hypothetical protein